MYTIKCLTECGAVTTEAHAEREGWFELSSGSWYCPTCDKMAQGRYLTTEFLNSKFYPLYRLLRQMARRTEWDMEAVSRDIKMCYDALFNDTDTLSKVEKFKMAFREMQTAGEEGLFAQVLADTYDKVNADEAAVRVRRSATVHDRFAVENLTSGRLLTLLSAVQMYSFKSMVGKDLYEQMSVQVMSEELAPDVKNFRRKDDVDE